MPTPDVNPAEIAVQAQAELVLAPPEPGASEPMAHAVRLQITIDNRTPSWVWSLHLDPGGVAPWPLVQAYPDRAAFVAFARPAPTRGSMIAQPLVPAGLPIGPGEQARWSVELPVPLRETALTRHVDPFAAPVPATSSEALGVKRLLVGLELVRAIGRGTPARIGASPDAPGVAVVPLATRIEIAWAWALLPSPVTLSRFDESPDALGNPPGSMIDALLPVATRRLARS